MLQNYSCKTFIIAGSADMEENIKLLMLAKIKRDCKATCCAVLGFLGWYFWHVVLSMQVNITRFKDECDKLKTPGSSQEIKTS